MSTEVKISKLTESKDWTIWKLQAKVVLRSLDVFDVVIGKEKPPELKDNPSQSDTVKYEEEYAKFDKKDVKAQSVIVTSVAVQPMTHIVNCKTAFEMWSKLHSVFEQKSEAGIHLLQQKFFTFEKDADDDMATFISKIETIVQQLDDLGEKIPESMVTTKILLALPSSYNHFHSAWESTIDSKKTLNDLRNRLMIEEKRMEAQSEHAEGGAFVAKRFNKFKRSNESNSQKGRKCFICHEYTHLKKDCPKRNTMSGNSSEALVCAALLSVCDSVAWYNDSGATEHMSNRSEWFYDYTVNIIYTAVGK